MSDVPSAAVGRCIYCPALIYSPLEAARKLGDEHIIPAGMGGTLVLPEASCKSCETATSGIESICINNLFSPAVPHFPWKTRAKLKKTFVRVSAGQSGASIKVPLADHPGTLTMFRFEVATEISGLPAPEVFTGKITVGPAMAFSDFKHRVNRIGGLNVKLGNGVSADTFGRLLAKIAHSYAVSQFGWGNFTPCLPRVIVGEPPYDDDLLRFVGTGIIEDEKSAKRHELGWEVRRNRAGQALIVVRIRLFAEYNMPSHYIVAGKLV